jgi:hypothetical protein
VRELTKVDLSVGGIWNGRPFTGSGIIHVNPLDGMKHGTVTYEWVTSPAPAGGGPAPPPPRGTSTGGSEPPPGPSGGDSGTIATVRCFIGAKPLGKKSFVGPLELLGREFTSVRSTRVGRRVGRSGTITVGESAQVKGSVLRTHLTTIGDVPIRRIRGIGPIREITTVSGLDTVVSDGRYSYLLPGGRTVPIRYQHVYRSLHPNRRLFRRMLGQRFLLRVRTSIRVHGLKVEYRTQSTVRRL